MVAKFIPKLIPFEQKDRPIRIAQNDAKKDPDLLKKIIACDEIWVYDYDDETKAQSSQWKRPDEPGLRKAYSVRSNVKIFITVFFMCYFVVYCEFLEYYL